ncbi:hypothetical protein BDR26DRAFT_858224 [Obelidium mucronatum]|nr:hypothetical protein BDR26DRAFT_858224 [Obelidium mucronatum]
MANGNATQPAMICVPAAMVPDSRVYLLGNMIYVMALENSVRGLLDAFFTVQNRGWSTNVKIVMLCNLWLISKYVLDVVHAFLPLEPPAKGGAQKWGFMYSISFAMSMITFDAFLLFKTWIVCSKTRFFKIAGIILLLIRTGWAAADIGMSYTECYPGIGCMFQQLPFFLIG